MMIIGFGGNAASELAADMVLPTDISEACKDKPIALQATLFYEPRSSYVT